MTLNPKEKTVRTCCQGCHEECGVLARVKDGRVVEISGDKAHPLSRGFVCAKGHAALELVYHPDRLKYPLRRAGARGEGKWQRITWDEALDTISARFEQIKREHNPLALAVSFGTGPHGYEVLGPQFGFALGCNIMCIVHVCFMPSVIVGMLTCGASTLQERGPDYQQANCILVWGANPVVSHPPHGKEILAAKKRGAKIIVVDPRRTPLAKSADIWLQIRPATDDALALGMLNVIINEELYDKEFVGKWCVGFEELRERVQGYPPDRVAEITWIPEEKIIEAARLYATTKPAALHHRVAIEQQAKIINNLRSFYILTAITGNIDVKGGNLIPRWPEKFINSLKGMEPPGKWIARLGAEQFPILSGPEAVFWPVSHNPSMIKAMLTDKPYPVKGLLTFNNLVLNSENTAEVWAALNRLDFMVAVDFFMTPTAELADIVLPAAHWLEKDEVAFFSYTNEIAGRQKAIEPLGECWDDKKLLLKLAERLKLKQWLPWDSVEEFNDYQLSEIGLTFDELKNKGYISGAINYRKYEKRGFFTPSGKVELYSSLLEKHGYDPLPGYRENPETPVSAPELLAEYPFILITGGRQMGYFHSEGRQLPSLRRMCPEPLMEINPGTAVKLGIREGDWVYIETPRGNGRVKQRAKLTDILHPQVVHAQHHWWLPERPGPDHGCWEHNINVIIPNDPPYDPVFGSTSLRGLLCKVYKA